MDHNQVLADVKQKFQATLEHFTEELKKLRTGRAHTSMLDGVLVEVYGTSMPLIQVATISTPEAQLLQITPFDPSSLQAIATAIRDNQSLGLNPIDDGRVIRVPIPALTSERRQEIAKQLRERVENSLISMRGSRHEALKTLEELKHSKSMSEDDFTRLEKQIDESLASSKAEIERLAKNKESDIMTL